MSTQDDNLMFRVRWEIDLAATDPRAAAQRALEIQRNPASIATNFEVTPHDAGPGAEATVIGFHEDAVDDTAVLVRRRRFNDLLDGYECGPGDWTMPTGPVSRDAAMRALPASRVPDGEGAERYLPGRYALVCESTSGHGYFVTNVADRREIDAAAAESARTGWAPVCYFDLDELAGDEPPVFEGDVIEHGGERWHVIRTENDLAEGVAFQWLHIDHDPAVEWLDGAAKRVDACECTIVERAEPDPRMPVRYGLARIVTTVAFNTTPSP